MGAGFRAYRQETKRSPSIKRTLLILTFLSAWASLTPVSADAGSVVLTATYEGAISPAASEWLTGAIRHANEIGAQALVIKLDTPGGLLESTRILVREISGSSVPVVVYVAPAGARAASAGTFITMAGHVAAMSPGTRIGAAHPVEMGKQMQGDIREKVENDTVAFIKTIAESKGRNAEWAESAVRKSSSATEKEALALGVIDFVARDQGHLLELLDGREVETVGGMRTIRTKDAAVVEFPMSLRVKILRLLSDPNVAYILMMVGIYGILYEIINPGAIFPGVVGSICLILGLYALQTLPISFAGAALLVLAVLLFVIESQVASGLLGLGGIIALALGSLMLIQGDYPLQISRTLILSTVLATAVFLFAGVSLVLKVRKRRAVSGVEAMVGQFAEARTKFDPKGQVLFGGEIWTAEPVAGETISKGDTVEIVSVDKLKLIVRKKEGKA